MTQQSYTKPLPRPTKLSRPFWEGAKRHELLLLNCNACARIWFPPSSRCPNCLSTDVAWKPASGRGKVWSWIVMWQRYFPAFDADLPYNVAYVQLDEGPKLMTNLVGVAPEDIRCDMPVEVVFDDVTEEFSLPKFRPVG